uniref:Uncharacterized protein n=1 Tax=Dulem virus 177 TaxID=3145654 RepID=A0AAU8B8E8_9VIRU
MVSFSFKSDCYAYFKRNIDPRWVFMSCDTGSVLTGRELFEGLFDDFLGYVNGRPFLYGGEAIVLTEDLSSFDKFYCCSINHFRRVKKINGFYREVF